MIRTGPILRRRPTSSRRPLRRQIPTYNPIYRKTVRRRPTSRRPTPARPIGRRPMRPIEEIGPGGSQVNRGLGGLFPPTGNLSQRQTLGGIGIPERDLNPPNMMGMPTPQGSFVQQPFDSGFLQNMSGLYNVPPYNPTQNLYMNPSVMGMRGNILQRLINSNTGLGANLGLGFFGQPQQQMIPQFQAPWGYPKEMEFNRPLMY